MRDFILPRFVVMLLLTLSAPVPAAEDDSGAASPPDGPAVAEPAPGEDGPEPTGQLIEGMVLNHFGGGIEDVTVRLESLDSGEKDKPLAMILTNGFGEVSMRLPEPVDGPVRVRIIRDGYQSQVFEVDPTDEDNPPFIDVTLEGAAKLTGRVTAAQGGRPVAGAAIKCQTGGRQLNTTSDDRGEFSLDSVFRGQAMLVATAEGFAIERKQVEVTGDTAETTIALRPERLIDLTVVTNEGDPAPEVNVETFVEPTRNYLYALTDEHGKARIRGMGADAVAVRLRLSGERYVRESEFSDPLPLDPAGRPAGEAAEPPATQNVSDGEDASHAGTGSTETVQLRRVIVVAASLKGLVTDKSTGQPIIGVRIAAGRKLRGDMPMTWTRLDGRYELIGLPPGNNVLTLQHNNYAPSVHEIELSTGATRELDAALEAGQEVSGVVVDEAGDPLTEVRVALEAWRGYESVGMRTIVGSDGTFTFAHVPPGDIDFSFVKPGFGAPVRKTLAAGTTDARITLKAETPALPPPGLTQGRIAIGEPVPDLELVATDGTTYSLKELSGKFVFLDCWASWCAPCIGEVDNLKAVYEATKDRADVVMLGLNLDSERKAMQDAVKEHDIAWPQVSGPRSGAEEAFAELEGAGIPYICLIGPDGTMLAQHLRGPGMVDEVKKHLAGKGGRTPATAASADEVRSEKAGAETRELKSRWRDMKTEIQN